MKQSDYIIVGGGLAGSVVAARLAEKNPSWFITVIEAGNDISDQNIMSEPLSCFTAHHSSIDWDYKTVPQTQLDCRSCYLAAGKALGGGTAVNYGTWTRGPKEDYDYWACVVDDERWSYNGLLPYFKKTESSKCTNFENQHGFSGPIHNISVSKSSPNRKYPLREPIERAWRSIGVQRIEDGNSGFPHGLAEANENWRDGHRQIASTAYGLREKSNIRILVNTIVSRILFKQDNSQKIAVGVELSNGETIISRKEVILSCGTFKTPQVLLLSGIGPAEELKNHKIYQNVELPVGNNLHDHLALLQPWSLRKPEQGLSLGTPLWSDSAFGRGLPYDFLASTSVPRDKLEKALGFNSDSQNGYVLDFGKCHLETVVVYGPVGEGDLKSEPDGSRLTTAVINMQPTSRGSIKLSSANPDDEPIIDPHYYETEFDRVAMIVGVRQAIQLMLGTDEGRHIALGEVRMPGVIPLTLDSSDNEIDMRIRRMASTFNHAAGTASMGSVVNSELQVFGVKSLRVVDASVFPVPICAHPQVPLYALAEQAADMISGFVD